MDQLGVLARAAYMAFLMARAEQGRKADPAPYLVAEGMLDRCLARAQSGQGWRLDSSEASHLAGLLAHHDAQLAACRAHAWNDALGSLADAEQAKRSLLVERDDGPESSAFFVQLMAMLNEPGADGLPVSDMSDIGAHQSAGT